MVHQMIAYVSGLAEGGRIRQEIAGDGRKPGIVESDGLVHVVNPDPLESETARCTPEEFAGRFGFQPARAGSPPTAAGSRARRTDRRRRLRSDELWPWLALTLVGLLLVENFLANRTAA